MSRSDKQRTRALTVRRFSRLVVIAILYSMNAAALQQEEVKTFGETTESKVRVIPGARYKAGWLHRLLFGSDWRALWTTPMEVEVLDLGSFAGGLTPIKRGGGMQTKSLSLEGNDGRRYKFRSIDKDPEKVLPAELRESIAADLLQDQISASHPLSAIVVAPILEAVGVLQAQPRIVVLPDDERLGEFREEFRGMLGTLEEQPDEGPNDEPGFAGAEKVIGTYKLFEYLEEETNERVDAEAFLTARLLDIYLGDWDRHADQWRWARATANGKKVWKPIPRDRDQAFSRYDGLFPWIATLANVQLESWGQDYPIIEDLTWQGRYLDRRFLVSLEKPAWDSVTTAVIERLTDSVIENALRQLPPEMYAKGAEAMEKRLKSRRWRLRAASEEYYKVISGYVDVRGTNKSEYAEIKRLDDHRLEVSLYERDQKTGGMKGKPFYRRMFDDTYTKDVRVYLLGGDDVAVVQGEVNSSISVRVIGGDGNDELIDNSNVRGYFLSVVPFIPDAETKTRLYDSASGTTFKVGPSTSVNTERVRQPANDLEKYEPPLRDWGYDWKVGPWYSAGSDDGLFLGGGPIRYKFGFRADPYVYRMELRGGYATGPAQARADYTARFFNLLRGARVLLHVRASGLDIRNFYGIGNETPRDEKLEDDNFYKVGQLQLLFHPTVEFPASGRTTFSLGGFIKYAETKLEDETFLKSTEPYGVGKISLLSIRGGFRVDTRDHAFVARKGFLFHLEGSYYPPVFNNRNSFGKSRAELRTYFSAIVLTETSLALKVAGEKIWGEHPFYEASFIGGNETIRGFKRERFAGDASVLGNVELRMHITNFSFLVPGTIGASLLGDTGRVFASGEDSGRWHSAVGGGVWFSFVRPVYVLSIAVARSSELTGLYVAGGFMF